MLVGKLTVAAFEHGPIETIAQLSVIFGALAAAGGLTYLKRWKWLWKEWLTSLDHKRIGIMYLILSSAMLARGAIDAGMMRAQQALAVGTAHGYLAPEHYAQIFTAHGVIMIFFVAMPFMFGLINLILPLQIGSRDVAYPFLNSISFWLTVAGAMLVNLSLVVGEFAGTGWLAYPPLSELAYSPGVGVDYYIWALEISGAGTLISSINVLATIAMMRCPRMMLMRLPIFAWTTLSSMVLVLFAFPILSATLLLLSLDRTLGMHFFTSSFGGNPMMYVNLIWAWGHPEVYILILPAFGIFSEIVPVFSQKRLFGYTSMVMAALVITVLSFVVWLHHFFTMGAGADVNAFFGIMTMAIAVPTGVKVFNWLFTMFRGRIIFATPMLWFMGFLATFTLGGVAGMLLALPGIDFQLHNSLFLVAHFHTMIIGGVLFGYFAGFSYWFPKIFGFTLDERLGTYAFWCWTIGFLIAFIPLYVLGFMGMTRRLAHIDASTGWHPLLVVAAVGAVVIGFGILFQILQIVVSIKNRAKNRGRAGDPWNGRTLEWSAPSPPPIYNFAIIPVVADRDAFWVLKKDKKTVPAKDVPHSYEDIHLPKNTAIPLGVALASLLSGFGIIWHIWWLAAFGIFGILTMLIIRSFDEEIDYTMYAYEIAQIEKETNRNDANRNHNKR